MRDQNGNEHVLDVEVMTCPCCGDHAASVNLDTIPVMDYRGVRGRPEQTVFILEDGLAELLLIRESTIRQSVGILTPEEFAEGL